MPLLDVTLSKFFPIKGGLWNQTVAEVQAVRDVSFQVEEGETLGIIGESGCGKSTLGKSIIGLHKPTTGRALMNGRPASRAPQDIQFIFQDPYSALNPRMTAGKTLREAIRYHKVVPRGETDAYIEKLLGMVQLPADAQFRYPHEFSGGQRQRLNIARALAVKPKVLIADEPVSALDVSVQAQILNLLMDLREELKLTILFISHDLKVVEHFCDRMLVMYLGKVVEELRCDDLHASAKHPYTQALLKSNPINDPSQRSELFVLEGEVPSPRNPPAGCAFASRCDRVEDACYLNQPDLIQIGDHQKAACWVVEREMRAEAAS